MRSLSVPLRRRFSSAWTWTGPGESICSCSGSQAGTASCASGRPSHSCSEGVSGRIRKPNPRAGSGRGGMNGNRKERAAIYARVSPSPPPKPGGRADHRGSDPAPDQCRLQFQPTFNIAVSHGTNESPSGLSSGRFSSISSRRPYPFELKVASPAQFVANGIPNSRGSLPVESAPDWAGPYRCSAMKTSCQNYAWPRAKGMDLPLPYLTLTLTLNLAFRGRGRCPRR